MRRGNFWIIFSKSVKIDLAKRMKRCNQSLVDNPYMGKLEPLIEYLPLSLRTFVLHPYYKIVYYVNEFEDCIYVITLWDSRRDPEEYVKELFDEKKD